MRERFERWVLARDQASDDRRPATAMYVGDHWHAVSQIANGSNRPTELWVLSAGYGLIRSDTVIAPYGATFAPGSPDSVSELTSRSDAQRWWGLLTRSREAEFVPPSIATLAARDPSDALVVVASANYIAASAPDLREAGSILGERLVVISIGGRDFRGLESHLVNLDARIEQIVGGARTALNARAARAILNSDELESISVPAVQRVADQLTANLGRPTVWNRRPHSDAEVIDWISHRLTVETVSRTRLLQEFRGEGRACEQSRFADLYRKAIQ